MAADVTMNVQH